MEPQQQQLEPILTPDPARFVLFPIKYHKVWEFYKKHVASFWTADEISFSEDTRHFESLTDDERFFIKHVLAFFAASDGIVNENLAINFIEEVQVFCLSLLYVLISLYSTAFCRNKSTYANKFFAISLIEEVQFFVCHYCMS